MRVLGPAYVILDQNLMRRYMLDTNTVSHLLRAHPSVARRVVAVPMASLCISAITEGELLFGLAKRPSAK